MQLRFLLLFLILAVPVNANIHVNESGWWLDEFNKSQTPITDAIEFAKDGDTIVIGNGTYRENILIDKEISIVSDGCQIYAGKPDRDVIRIENTNNVKISGLTIIGATEKSGIRIYNASNCTVENCRIFENGNGIYIRGTGSHPSKNNSILNCVVSGNKNGIKLSGKGCTGNDIRFNDIERNRYGIYSTIADSNEISNNNIIENDVGVYLTTRSERNVITFNNLNNYEWNLFNDQNVTIEAKYNYWYLTTNLSIDKTIYDDDEGGGLVEFYPYLVNPAIVGELAVSVLMLMGSAILLHRKF